jgi:hypothetical protein
MRVTGNIPDYIAARMLFSAMIFVGATLRKVNGVSPFPNPQVSILVLVDVSLGKTHRERDMD